MLSRKSLQVKWQQAVEDGEEDRDFETFCLDYGDYLYHLELDDYTMRERG